MRATGNYGMIKPDTIKLKKGIHKALMRELHLITFDAKKILLVPENSSLHVYTFHSSKEQYNYLCVTSL
jgi:hypothetical protein